MKSAKKAKPPLRGSAPAAPLVAEAIRQLLKQQAKAEILKKRMAFLRKLIMDNGGGTAYGYRAYAYEYPARSYWCRSKAGRTLKLVPLPLPDKS